MRKCELCKTELTRVGQKRFCSNKCSTANLKNINKKHREYGKCENCENRLNSHKSRFCSSKCCASFHNKKQAKYCVGCNEIISIGWSSKKYCSSCSKTEKNPNYKDWSSITLEEFSNGRTLFNTHARLRYIARRFYKSSDKPKHCINCDYRNHYEVCHVKPIKDFPKTSSVSEINHLDNLVALCPNCHWDLDHGILKL